MMNIEDLGWDTRTVGELDHRRLKAPSIKLRSARCGENGDIIYCVDLRVRRPNVGACLSSTELHSIEHFLLAGFQHHLPSHFVSVGVMGCQTGFYLVFLNEGRSKAICDVLESILADILKASMVPYASIEQCGNYMDHDLGKAQDIARAILAARTDWLDAA
ncbi:S-ribosylhomocysteine lyase [Alcaligenaceae bacterium CGII-47]|nr:S-ribosylhomocysteine lyase [Alcaligenaceae bacterium CGII-47]